MLKDKIGEKQKPIFILKKPSELKSTNQTLDASHAHYQIQ
jgi:hypothetical protein